MDISKFTGAIPKSIIDSSVMKYLGTKSSMIETMRDTWHMNKTIAKQQLENQKNAQSPKSAPQASPIGRLNRNQQATMLQKSGEFQKFCDEQTGLEGKGKEIYLILTGGGGKTGSVAQKDEALGFARRFLADNDKKEQKASEDDFAYLEQAFNEQKMYSEKVSSEKEEEDKRKTDS